MKRVEKGDRRGQSKTAGEGKRRQFFSFLCQLHIHVSWGLGMQSALCTLREHTAAREKQQVTRKGNPIHITADLSAETLQARGEWQDIFKILKGKNLQPRLLYPARISFKIDGEIKSFS